MFSSNAGLLSAWNSGNESVAAQTYGTRVLVPAAFGTGPGSVVVYVGRAFGTFGLPPYVFTTLGNPDGMSRYYRLLAGRLPPRRARQPVELRLRRVETAHLQQDARFMTSPSAGGRKP